MPIIKASPKASIRTLNRLREHGPNFEILKDASGVLFADGFWVMVESPDKWFGWLARNEVWIEGIDDEIL